MKHDFGVNKHGVEVWITAGQTLSRRIAASHLVFWLATAHIEQAACSVVLTLPHTRCHMELRPSNVLNIPDFLIPAFPTSFQTDQRTLRKTAGISGWIIFRSIMMIYNIVGRGESGQKSALKSSPALSRLFIDGSGSFSHLSNGLHSFLIMIKCCTLPVSWLK